MLIYGGEKSKLLPRTTWLSVSIEMNSRGNGNRYRNVIKKFDICPLLVDGFVVRIILSGTFLQEILASGISSKRYPPVKLR